MADIKEFPDVPGYVSIKQAAEILGITDKRVYRYIDLGRLPAYKSGGAFLLAEEDVRRFQLNPPGRVRTGPPAWRLPNPRSPIIATDVYVQVRDGQQTHLLEKLRALHKAGQHTLPGTINRYIVKGDANLTTLHFFLVWKDRNLGADIRHHPALLALQEELADVLLWETAEYHTNQTLLYT